MVPSTSSVATQVNAGVSAELLFNSRKLYVTESPTLESSSPDLTIPTLGWNNSTEWLSDAESTLGNPAGEQFMVTVLTSGSGSAPTTRLLRLTTVSPNRRTPLKTLPNIGSFAEQVRAGVSAELLLDSVIT